MKIAMVISGLRIGGAELTLLNLVERLRGDFEIYIVSLSDVGPVGERLQEMNVPVYSLEMQSPLSIPAILLRLVKLLKQIRPDVVHTWMYHGDCIGGLAARLAGVPGIGWSVHSFNIGPGMLKRSTRLLVKVCAMLSWYIPKKIISCSKAGVDVHVAAGYDASKFVFIPNGVDVGRFKFAESARSSVRNEFCLAADTLIVGLVGRFDVQKNHVGFFEAAGLIHRRLPSAHFILAGAGVDERNEMILAAIDRAGVTSVTHLLGMRNDVPRLISAMDVLASSSHGEAFPLVLVEAMACGVPCVVTNVGDSADIVGDAGRVVEPGDMTRLAAAIQEILCLAPNARTALGERAIRRVRDNYELTEIVQMYKRLYFRMSGYADADAT